MPITRRQFELGINEQVEEVMKAISEFLATRRQEAFEKHELASALGVLDAGDEPLERMRKFNSEVGLRFVSAMSRLVELGVVQVRLVEGSEYYATGRHALSDLLVGNSTPENRG